MGPCKIQQALPVGVVGTPSSKQRGRRQSIGGMSQGCKFSWTFLGTSFVCHLKFIPQKSRWSGSFQVSQRHLDTQDSPYLGKSNWRQFGETWLGNVWPLGSPDRAILSPAGKTMAAQKNMRTPARWRQSLSKGCQDCPSVQNQELGHVATTGKLTIMNIQR